MALTLITADNIDTTTNPTVNAITVSTNTATIGTAAYFVANGNLGIGTSLPGQRLDLGGGSLTLSSSTGTQQVYLYRFSSTNYSSIGTDSSAGGVTFTTGTSSPSERMRIDSSGNVGIGTSSPTSKLHVAGNTINSGVLITNLTSALNIGIVSNYATWQGSGTSDDLVVAGFGARNLILGTNAAERMRIDSNGKALIGLTISKTYGTTLQVQGGIQNFGATSASISDIIAYDYNSVDASPTYAGAVLRKYGSTATGNLYVVSTVAAAGWAEVSGINTNGLSIGTNGASPIIFGTTASERMRIDSSGNILIGSADAGNTLRYLDVQNANTGSSAGAIMRFITANVAGTGVTSVDIVKYKSGGFYINNNETNTAAHTAFNVGASERMRIDSAGRVTMPYQPSFSTYGGTNSTLTGTPLGLVFTSALTNVGSNYSTTTGRFTAPVAGTYLFSWTLTQSTALTGPVSYLYKNGVSSTAGVIAYGVSYNNATMNVILTLAASDYVQVFAVAFNSTSPVLDMGYMQFSGHLIG